MKETRDRTLAIRISESEETAFADLARRHKLPLATLARQLLWFAVEQEAPKKPRTHTKATYRPTVNDDEDTSAIAARTIAGLKAPQKY